MRGGSDDSVRGVRLIAHRAPAGSYAVEFLRYGAASAPAFAADVATLLLLTEKAGVHYLAPAAARFGVGILIAYVLSIRWVFSFDFRLRKSALFTVPLAPKG